MRAVSPGSSCRTRLKVRISEETRCELENRCGRRVNKMVDRLLNTPAPLPSKVKSFCFKEELPKWVSKLSSCWTWKVFFVVNKQLDKNEMNLWCSSGQNWLQTMHCNKRGGGCSNASILGSWPKKFTQSIRKHITEFLNLNVNVIQQFLVLVRAASRMLVLKKNSKLIAYNTFEHTCKKREIPEIYLRNFFLDFPQNFRLRTRNQYCTQAIVWGSTI